ncbi:MAG: Wzy polymerase domain-containing protein [Methylotenera sp.]|nr:Wzy polymerase domain-containing protein [Methylotenera sp.]
MFIGLMFLLPFVVLYHHLPIPSFYGEWVAATLGLLAMLPLLRKASWQSFQVPQIALIFLGLAAIISMQWMLGMLHSNQYALLVLSYVVWAFFLVILGGYLRRELGWEKVAITLAWFIVIGGLINVGIVGLQYAVQQGLTIPFITKVQGYGAITQRNHVANYTSLALASLIYLYAKERFSLKAFTLLCALFLVMLSFTGSRSSWLYLIAFTVLAVILQANAMKQRMGSKNIRSLLRASLLLIPAFILAQLFVYFAFPDGLIELPSERLLEQAAATNTSLRLQFWYDSWRMFLQSPWLGVGTGAMRGQSFLLLDAPTAMASGRVFEHSHNLFLHLLAEMGIGAFLIVLAGVIAWLLNFKWRELSLETWWLLALLAVLGIHSMLEYPLWYTYFLGIAAVLLGAGEEKLTTIKLPNIGQFMGRTVLALVLVFGVVNLGSMAVANIKLESWLLHGMQGKIKKKDQPDFYQALAWVHKNSMLAPYAELMYAHTITPNAAGLNEKLWVSQSALSFIPMRKVAYRYVLFLKLKGNQAAAVKQLNRTMIAFPGDFTKELQSIPFKHWQDYLDVLSEARPMQQKQQ